MAEILSAEELRQIVLVELPSFSEWGYGPEVERICASHEALRAENERLRAALNVYANAENWSCGACEMSKCDKPGMHSLDVWNGQLEGPQIARDTLHREQPK